MTETKFNRLDRNNIEEANFPYQLSIFGKRESQLGRQVFNNWASRIGNWIDFMSSKIAM